MQIIIIATFSRSLNLFVRTLTEKTFYVKIEINKKTIFNCLFLCILVTRELEKRFQNKFHFLFVSFLSLSLFGLFLSLNCDSFKWPSHTVIIFIKQNLFLILFGEQKNISSRIYLLCLKKKKISKNKACLKNSKIVNFWR